MAASNDAIVKRFMAAMGLDELLNWPEYRDNDMRMRNRPALHARIDEKMTAQTVDYWIEKLNAAGVPCGRVLTLPEVLRDPQVLAQEMVIESHDSGGSPVKMTGFPVKLSHTPCRLRRGAPDLGGHTEEILAEAGYGQDDIESLRQSGILGGS